MKKRNLRLVKLSDIYHIPVRLYRGKHTKKCECPPCLKAKIAAFEERVEQMAVVRMPTDSGATVPVRAHWRKQRNHLANSPELRKAVEQIVTSLFRKSLKAARA